MLLVVSKIALAKEASALQNNSWTEYGVRPLAMGNAFVAIADDENAFYYNAAGLAFQKKSYSYVPFELQSSTRLLSNLIEYISTLSNEDESNDALLKLIDDNIGEVNSIEFRYSPWYFTGLWGVSPIVKKYATAIVHRQPSLELQSGLDLTIPFSIAYAFFDKTLALGTSLNIKMSNGYNEFISPNDLDGLESGETQDFEDFKQNGIGLGVDLGVIYRKDIEKHQLSAGLSWKNIGDMAYYQIGDNLTPDEDLASINLGLAYKYRSENYGKYHIAIDAHSLNQDFSFTKKLNLGIGVLLEASYELLMGLHQGYVSAGIRLIKENFNFEFSTWAEEYGMVAGDDPDRRIGLKYIYYF